MNWPDVDPRIHAIGVSKLRVMTAAALRKISGELYILQERDEPVAVLLNYQDYLALQDRKREP